jgi:hypothetical protein
MKRILSIATALVLLATGSGFAADVTPMLDKGTKTLQLSGSLDTDTPNDFDWTLGAQFGYFFWDNFELGFAAAGGGNDLTKNYDLGLYGQYNIATGSAWVPFLFLGGYYAGAEVDDEIYNVTDKADFDTAVGKVGGGIAWFLRDGIAIDARVLYNWAADDLWVDQDGNAQDSNVEGLLGLRFYWK